MYRLILLDCMHTVLAADPSRLPRLELAGRSLPSTVPLLHRFLQERLPGVTLAQVQQAAQRAWEFSQERRRQDLREVPARCRFARLLEWLGWPGDRAAGAQALTQVHMQAVVGSFFLPQARRQVLDALRRRFRLGLLSNFDDAAALQGRLQQEQVAHWFEPCLISEAIGVRKPAPQAFALALQQAELPPHEVLFVGDSWEEDVLGAAGAGLDAVWVNPRGLPLPQGGVRPVRVVQDITELASLAAP